MVLSVRAYGRRLLDDLELGIASAWHGQSFARTARLPDLGKVLARSKDTPGGRHLDQAFTANETRRWRQFFADQAGK